MTSSRDIAPKTVVEACFALDGTAALEMVYDLAAAVGLDAQPVRLAIRRMEVSGVLQQEGRGRKGRLVLTEAGQDREKADARYLAVVSAQDAGVQTWDGAWKLFTFSVPERFRAERDGIRSALVRLGAASLAHGVYVSPFALRDEMVKVVGAEPVARYLISAEATRLDGPGLGDPLEIVETLWPGAEIENAYRGLANELAAADRLPDSASVPDRLACALKLAGAFTVAVERDPFIPPELRRSDWSPPALRRAFRSTWVRLQRDLPTVSLFQSYETNGEARRA
ncbi:PaaX family transcriptional regulator [Diaminobutyricibacter sp. McL0608]|uniref:PaaX family transcriptional regulator n=1 Tax=Leifsonia sp. McL0608 TaxID=3143537 RepID=UPI0031F32400